MNGKITAILFPALLTAMLLLMGYIANTVNSLDAKVDALSINQSRNNTLLELLMKRYLK